MDLGLEVTVHDGVPVLVVRGEVDVATAPRFRQSIVGLADEGGHWAIVDLEGVDFLDSTGLGVLVSGLKRFRTLGGDLVLICTQRRILRVFEITRLDRAFSILPSRNEAAAAIASQRS